MRKYIRNIIRQQAKWEKAKPSKWLRIAFDTHQCRIFGTDKRKRNQAKGTHKKQLWPTRIALFESR